MRAGLTNGVKSKFTKSVAGIAAVTLVGGTLAGCSTQTTENRPWGKCAVIGAATGAALGGGGAAGVASATGPSNDPRHDEMGTGAMIGVLVGGALGAIIGHYTCDPVITPPAPSPPSAPPPPPPPPPPAKEKLVLRGVHFDFDKSEIRPGDAAVLDEAATALKANPGVSVNVNGYCDAIGGEKYNQELSERRAASVARYLVKAGIPESQLVPQGHGKTDFVATNATAEGRAQNRRVELVPAQ
jgi:outer membrane protein OmpA-like peptidoglycan-associated protein